MTATELPLSTRGVYARPAGFTTNANDHALGRTVLLVVPGYLVRLTPAEALRLAEQLRGAVEQERADAGDDDHHTRQPERPVSKTAKTADPPTPAEPPPPPDVGRSLLDLLGRAEASDLAAMDTRIGELEAELTAVREVRKLVAARLGLLPERKKGGPKREKVSDPAADGPGRGNRQPHDAARPNAPVRRGLIGAAEKKLAAYLSKVGPRTLDESAAGCGVERAHLTSAVRCDWFAALPDGRVSVTPLGRQEALDE